MAMVKKSITITDQQEAWLQSQMASGHYATDSELVREAIREKQMRTEELDAIRRAIAEGERSGLSDRTPEEIFDAVVARKRDNGTL